MIKKIVFAVTLFPLTAGATGVPVFDPHGACVYETMREDFQAIASVEGLAELSADLLDALNKHKSELVKTNTSSLRCDPENDFVDRIFKAAESAGAQEGSEPK
ncbi:hypothetical protein AB5Q25_003401 [Vibrio cholerae]